jgi:hypothetical protein
MTVHKEATGQIGSISTSRSMSTKTSAESPSKSRQMKAQYCCLPSKPLCVLTPEENVLETELSSSPDLTSSFTFTF